MEYKVVPFSHSELEELIEKVGKLTTEQYIEIKLNAYAKEGWKLSTIHHFKSQEPQKPSSGYIVFMKN